MAENAATKVDIFFSSYPERTYPKGQILVFADENPEYVFYVTSGRVRKYDVSYRGEEVIINVFKAPSFFPMSWAINRMPNKFFYKTETATTLHIVPADEAIQFVRDNPDVMFDLLSRLYKGLEGLYGRLVHLMSGTAHSRLVYELLIECRRFGQKQPDGSCTLAISEVDLAARSGLSRETVSREISKLKARNIIQLVSKTIIVQSTTDLEMLLGAEL